MEQPGQCFFRSDSKPLATDQEGQNSTDISSFPNVGENGAYLHKHFCRNSWSTLFRPKMIV